MRVIGRAIDRGFPPFVVRKLLGHLHLPTIRPAGSSNAIAVAVRMLRRISRHRERDRMLHTVPSASRMRSRIDS